MITDNIFITITGVSSYFGMKPFEIGRVFKLIKEPDNKYDEKAIRAELPYIDKIGYVANSQNKIAKGTLGGNEIFNMFDTECSAEVLFTTQTKVICKLLPLTKSIEFIK